jgi:hypothetical protein
LPTFFRVCVDEGRVKTHVGSVVGNLCVNGRGRALAREGEWWGLADGLSGMKPTDLRPLRNDGEPTGMTHAGNVYKSFKGNGL